MPKKPWWESIPLKEMNQEQWELLCDGCAKCCRIQLEDDQGARATTNVVCRYLDQDSCQCTCYEARTEKVPLCLKLTPENLDTLDWMPDTCAYRLINEGKPLQFWHPLVSKERDSIHDFGQSVRSRVFSELEVDEDALESHIIQWH